MQRVERRVAEIAAVPIGHPVDFHGLEHRRQAGRGHQVIDGQALALEHRELAGPDIGRRDEQARGLGLAQALEIDLLGERLAQRVDVERVRHVGAGREHLGPEFGHRIALPQVEQPADEVALRRPEIAVEADLAPEPLQPLPSAVRPALQPAVDHHDAVHRSGACPGHRLEGQAPVLDQRVEHAPGEGPVRAAALQGQSHRLLGPGAGEELVGRLHRQGLDPVRDRNFGDGGRRVVRLTAVGVLAHVGLQEQDPVNGMLHCNINRAGAVRRSETRPDRAIRQQGGRKPMSRPRQTRHPRPDTT